jgi:hypothetical protein
MFMVVSTMKWNEFIIQGLDPIRFLVTEIYRLRDGNINIHIDAYPSIGSVLTMFGCFYKFDIGSQCVTYAFQDFLVPIFM